MTKQEKKDLVATNLRFRRVGPRWNGSTLYRAHVHEAKKRESMGWAVKFLGRGQRERLIIQSTVAK